jgi:hypothetical protein
VNRGNSAYDESGGASGGRDRESIAIERGGGGG